MRALTIDRAATELTSLRELALERTGLALGAALAALPVARVDLSLGAAVAIGAIAEAALAVSSSVRRRALIARLALEEGAYVIPEVHRYGSTLTSTRSRRAAAVAITSMLRGASESRTGVALADRVVWQAPALAELARALAESERKVEPTAMAACMRLLADGRESPLLNPALPRSELERVLHQIRAGISAPYGRSRSSENGELMPPEPE